MRNKKGYVSTEFITLISIITLILLVSLFMLVHMIYITPEIELKADTECKLDGFDTFESYNTKGIWPTDYLVVKCKFVENRRDFQGGINLNGN